MAKVFISYRRADSAPQTGRIYDRLVQRFGRKNVFKDVDDIPVGVNFVTYIRESLAQCAVSLVVIGPSWLEIRKPSGERRLDDPADFVRIEVETALALGLTVIPVLLEAAIMPSPEQLPASLRPLALVNAVVVRNDPDFSRDMERVTAGIGAAFAARPLSGILGRRSAPASPSGHSSINPSSGRPPYGSQPSTARSPVQVAVRERPAGAAALPSRLSRAWRPLVAGLAAIVVVASFAALLRGIVLSGGKGGGSTARTPVTSTTPPHVTLKEYPLAAGATVYTLTAGPDGAVWFFEVVQTDEFTSRDDFGRVSSSSPVTEYSSNGGFAQDLTSGPDGALWFTEPGANKLGRISATDGSIKEFAAGHGHPTAIALGPDNALWFTEPQADEIGRITTSGAWSEHALPGYTAAAITGGSDGALWFAGSGTAGRKIGRMDATTGKVTDYNIPSGYNAGAIITGPDKAIWFTEPGANKIGRINPSTGAINEYRGGASDPADLVTGPDGALWFTETLANKIGRMTTDGVLTAEYSVSGGPDQIALASDGTLWFTEGINSIGRLSIDSSQS